MKRLFDIVIAFLVAPFLLFLSGLVAIGVWISLGRPILFQQLRPGRDGMPFVMHKFRSMLDRCDSQGNLMPDKDRLTRFGKFLRSTSLDELPELWNVLKGDMSLVGPRPLLMEYLPLYSSRQYRRHEVRPGITGWAQVNGRNALSWEERLEMDVWYVDNHTFLLDCRILMMTILKVFTREGISAKGEATMSKFHGSNRK